MSNLNGITLETQVKNALHPYWEFKNEINKKTCKKIIGLGNKKWIEARINKCESTNNVVDTNKRITDVAWCNEQWLYEIVWNYLHSANLNSNWNFQIDSCEPMQITRYKKNGHYDFHNDGNGFTRFEVPENKFINGKTRKLSMTIVLNDDYEGGEFEFFDDKKLIKEKTGTIIVFPSYQVHKVRPVTKGTRYSLVVWFCGEPLR
tara:strand:+ start:1629 stop:2240 length:612 start_codon:yes stop_codon:yes gene_type:complete